MNKDMFIKDIKTIYTYISKQKYNINQLFTHLEKNNISKLTIIDKLASKLDLEKNIDDKVRLALINRIVNLRDDSLIQILKNSDKSNKEIVDIKEKAYNFVKDFWHNQHQDIINFINENNLLTPFYRKIFEGVYNVGIKMSNLHISWNRHIIENINKELIKKFDNNQEKIFKYLRNNNLLDIGHNNQECDRCYSALIEDNNIYKSKTYIEIFKKETIDVIDTFEEFISSLIEEDDDIYNQKWEYILYLQSLIKAFSQKDVNKSVNDWSIVDQNWMKINTPFQIGHPLEYYEDHFRKAVAIEWDLRLQNPNIQNSNKTLTNIKTMFKYIFENLNINENKIEEYNKIFDFSQKSLNKIQLYLSTPAMFFGACFNGLFSAQVVPNDEIVSKKEGKKIFAFNENILQSTKSKPFLKLSKEIFGQKFLTQERNFLFKEEKKWYEIYDITTIGHEYGHILWCDEYSETIMNKTGNFKNIEEFKATTSGLVSFFLNEKEDLKKHILNDTIKRAISLIAWQRVNEVLPYYCEGLIHLEGLFNSKILNFDNNQLQIDTSNNNYKNLKNWYINIYKKLALHYLDKKDAKIFLDDYLIKQNGYFLPKNQNIRDFVDFYYTKYEKIGQELDNSDKKENYI